MEEINELIAQRIKKLEYLREAGIEPFGGSFFADDHAGALHDKFETASKESLESDPVACSLAGRIVAMRDFGKAAFAHIQDTSGKIQVYLKKDMLGENYILLKKIDIGDIVGVKGEIFKTRTGEITIVVKEFQLLSRENL